MPEPIRVLVLAPHLNGAGLGEVYSIFRWVEALSNLIDVTVLTLSPDKRLITQLPNAEVIVFQEPRVLSRMPRLNATVKPWLPFFFSQARQWIRGQLAKGVTWDLAHQVLPQAMRYACPLSGLGLPYVIGPLGGSLDTPAEFRTEVPENGLARLRSLDQWRLRNDPWLRRGYANAELVLGVAPYVAKTMADAGISLRRFEPILERALDGATPAPKSGRKSDTLHLVHVGRVVRTKGLRDVIRALAQLDDHESIHLTSAGDGPDLDACRTEAAQLGLSTKVSFLGQVPKSQVEQLFADADIFCFPSFREPMGGVFFEAMQYGLPIIAAARGGPDFILDDKCALKVPVETPKQFANDIAKAIRKLAKDLPLRQHMGNASLKRLKSIGDWDLKAARLESLYRETLSNTNK